MRIADMLFISHQSLPYNGPGSFALEENITANSLGNEAFP